MSENETRKHILEVARYMTIFAAELMRRACEHDASKLEPPEREIFEEWTPKLRGVSYGSKEYNEMLAKMKPALDHHYACNKHHPEFNTVNGFAYQTLNDSIRSMDLVDVVEMICDWLAAVQRHTDGNIGYSISTNAKRFNLDGQLEALLRNTAALLERRADGSELKTRDVKP